MAAKKTTPAKPAAEPVEMTRGDRANLNYILSAAAAAGYETSEAEYKDYSSEDLSALHAKMAAGDYSDFE